MAKPKKKEWPKRLKDLKGYVKIDDSNKAKGLVIGRTVYDIDVTTMTCRCAMDVRPRLQKGNWFVSNHTSLPDFDFWVINEEESVTEYREYLLKTVGKLKENGTCYIKLSDSVAKYQRE